MLVPKLWFFLVGVEKKVKETMVDLGLTLLNHASLPLQFWDYAFTTAVYLINRLPIASLNFSIPFVTLFNKDPDFEFLKTFGWACFPLLRPYHAHKLNFWGISPLTGYRCLSSTAKIYISKDVLFNELRLSYSDLFPSSSKSIKNLDSYFSPNPNLSPTSQSSQLSYFHSPSALLLSLYLFILKLQSPQPLVNPLLSLFQHLTLSQLTLTLCRQGPSLDFTILDYILLYFLLILNPKL